MSLRCEVLARLPWISRASCKVITSTVAVVVFVRKHSADLTSISAAASNIASISTLLDNVQQQHKYTNNKCVRCLTHALATRPGLILEFVDKLASYITHHENGELRDSRSFVKAQHNFLCCVERVYKAAEKSSRRPSETITSIAAAAAAAMMEAESEAEDEAASSDYRADAAMLSPTETTQAEVVLPILCQVMHKLVGQAALEVSYMCPLVTRCYRSCLSNRSVGVAC